MARRVQVNPTWAMGPVSGPAVGLLGAVFVTKVGQVVEGFPFWAPILLALVGCFAAVVVGRHNKTRRANIAFRCACWVGAASWTVWTILNGWSWLGFILLVGGAVLAGLLAPAFASYTPPPAAASEPPPEPKKFEDRLVSLIMRNAGLRPEERPAVSKVGDWPNKTGHTWLVEGALGSPFNWQTLRDIQVALAAGLRLPPGCPVNSVRANTHQGAALLHVSTVNDMDQVIPYPEDYSPRSVRQEFPIGLFLDKTPTTIELYQASGLIAGRRGGGKTVLLQGITATLVRCTDALVWHVDLNGGGMSAAWTTPFALGEVSLPVVDWVATSPGEALLMARVGTEIAKDRKRRYQRMMIIHNTDILPVGNGVDTCHECKMIHPPAISIIVDEGGEVTGEDASKEAKQAAADLRELQRIGRAMCVNVLFSVQRGTADYVPSQMKKAVALSICTMVKDESELAYVFDWKKGLNAEDLMYPGQAYIQRNAGAVQMFKAYGILPRQITEIAAATVPLRPRLDQAAMALGGEIYRNRWGRPDIVAFMAGLRGDDPDGDITPIEINFNAPELIEGGLGAMQDAISIMDETIKSARNKTSTATAADQPKPAGNQPPQPRQAIKDQVMSRRPDEIMSELEAVAALPEYDPEAPPARFLPAGQVPANAQASGARTPARPDPSGGPAARYAFVVQLVDQAGPEGIKTEEVVKATIAAGFTRRDSTVKETLTEARKAGDVFQREGSENYAKWWGRRYAAA